MTTTTLTVDHQHVLLDAIHALQQMFDRDPTALAQYVKSYDGPGRMTGSQGYRNLLEEAEEALTSALQSDSVMVVDEWTPVDLERSV